VVTLELTTEMSDEGKNSARIGVCLSFCCTDNAEYRSGVPGVGGGGEDAFVKSVGCPQGYNGAAECQEENGEMQTSSGSVVTMYACVCLRHSKTKTTGLIVTKLDLWSPISFEVKRSTVKVTGSRKYNVETAAVTDKHSPESIAMNIILQSDNINVYLRSEGRMSRSA